MTKDENLNTAKYPNKRVLKIADKIIAENTSPKIKKEFYDNYRDVYRFFKKSGY